MARCQWLLAMTAVGIALGAGQGLAQPAPPATVSTTRLTDAEIQRGRAGVLQNILTGNLPGVARWSRQSCAFRDGAADVAKARAEGRVTAPDAGEGCVAALTRQAHDGALIAFYEDALKLKTGSSDGAQTLPQRLVDAIQSGKSTIDLSRGMMLEITPGLAFDVGFTAAYWDGADAQQVTVDPFRLRTMTENCVGQRGSPKTCFGMGYVQGAAAYRTTQRVTSR
jgi:hypothetical protein